MTPTIAAASSTLDQTKTSHQDVPVFALDDPHGTIIINLINAADLRITLETDTTQLHIILHEDLASRLLTSLSDYVNKYKRSLSVIQTKANEIKPIPEPHNGITIARLRWQQAEGKRHAVKLINALHPRPGETFHTLCGESATPQRHDYLELGGTWHNPTCTTCNKIWTHMLKAGKVNPTGELQSSG